MHQCLTIAKVRKAQTIEVPAGGWVLLVSPDEPFNVHSDKRRQILTDSVEVNDEYEIVAVGRMDNKFADAKFLTSKEKKAAVELAKKTDLSFSQSNEAAKKRQQDLAAAERAKEQAAHEARVKDVSAQNDAIRTRKHSPDHKPLS